jgi:hypothetical protein
MDIIECFEPLRESVYENGGRRTFVSSDDDEEEWSMPLQKISDTIEKNKIIRRNSGSSVGSTQEVNSVKKVARRLTGESLLSVLKSTEQQDGPPRVKPLFPKNRFTRILLSTCTIMFNNYLQLQSIHTVYIQSSWFLFTLWLLLLLTCYSRASPSSSYQRLPITGRRQSPTKKWQASSPSLTILI